MFAPPAPLPRSPLSAPLVRRATLAALAPLAVYTRTRGRIGLDFCSATFNSLVVVRQEDFEDSGGASQPNTRKTAAAGAMPQYANTISAGRPAALFSDVFNAFPHESCGSVDGSLALTFAGSTQRWAESIDVNLDQGGQLEFYLIYGGAGVSRGGALSDSPCRVVYAGRMYLSYSVNGGKSWTQLRKYGMEYQQAEFTRVVEVMPPAAVTPATRFRWEVKRFDDQLDFIAIDNVTVVSQALPGGWQQDPDLLPSAAGTRSRTETLTPATGKWYRGGRLATQKVISRARCCYGSARCVETGSHRGALRNTSTCGNPEFQRLAGDAPSQHLLSAGQHAVCAALLMWVLRLVWRLGERTGLTTLGLAARSMCCQIFRPCCASWVDRTPIHPFHHDVAKSHLELEEGVEARRFSMQKGGFVPPGDETLGADGLSIYRSTPLRRWLAEREREELAHANRATANPTKGNKIVAPTHTLPPFVKVAFPPRFGGGSRRASFVGAMTAPVGAMVALAVAYVVWSSNTHVTTFALNFYTFHDFVLKPSYVSDHRGRQSGAWAAGDQYKELHFPMPVLVVVVAAIFLDVVNAILLVTLAAACRARAAPSVYVKFCTKNLASAARLNTDALIVESEATRWRQWAAGKKYGYQSRIRDATRVVIPLREITASGDILRGDQRSMIAGMVVSAQPWACMAVLSYEATASPILGISLGTIASLRALLGPMFATRLMLILTHILDFCDTRQNEKLAENCGSVCLRCGCICSLFGLAASAIGLAVLALADESLLPRTTPDETYAESFAWLWILPCTIFVAALGSALGFSRGLAVEPLVFPTDLSGTTVYVKYKGASRCCCADGHCFPGACKNFCEGLWTQESFISVCVDDADDLKDYLRAHPPPRLSQDELAVHTRREELEEKMGPDELRKCRDAFHAIDVNDSGGISPTEMCEFLHKHYEGLDENKAELDEALKRVDTNRDASIDWLEFLEMVRRSRRGGDMLGDLLCTVFDLTVSGFDAIALKGAIARATGSGSDSPSNSPVTVTTKKSLTTAVADLVQVLPTIPPEKVLMKGGHELAIVDLTTESDLYVDERLTLTSPRPFKCARSWCSMNVDPKEVMELHDQGGGLDCTYHPGHMFEVRRACGIVCVGDSVCVCVCVSVCRGVYGCVFVFVCRSCEALCTRVTRVRVIVVVHGTHLTP